MAWFRLDTLTGDMSIEEEVKWCLLGEAAQPFTRMKLEVGAADRALLWCGWWSGGAGAAAFFTLALAT